MYWLRRPPYLRWIAAAIVLVLGLLMDLRSAPTDMYPFAASSISAGSQVVDKLVWREVPDGLLPSWDVANDATVVAAIEAGEPLLPSHVGAAVVPAGWWNIALSLPTTVAPGTAVRVVLGDGSTRDGITSGAVVDDGYQLRGSVAFSPDDAPLVAKAAADDALVVMMATRDDGTRPGD